MNEPQLTSKGRKLAEALVQVMTVLHGPDGARIVLRHLVMRVIEIMKGTER